MHLSSACTNSSFGNGTSFAKKNGFKANKKHPPIVNRCFSISENLFLTSKMSLIIQPISFSYFWALNLLVAYPSAVYFPYFSSGQ